MDEIVSNGAPNFLKYSTNFILILPKWSFQLSQMRGKRNIETLCILMSSVPNFSLEWLFLLKLLGYCSCPFVCLIEGRVAPNNNVCSKHHLYIIISCEIYGETHISSSGRATCGLYLNFYIYKKHLPNHMDFPKHRIKQAHPIALSSI